MLIVQISKGELLVKDDSKEIFNWKHRAFFNISMGFELDEKGNNYIFKNRDELRDAVKEIIIYLQEENLPYSVDKQVSEIIATIKKQESEFSDVTKNLNIELKITKPPTFKRELKPYQVKGYEHLLKVKHGANFSVPGSGKTTMVYSYYDKLKQDDIIEKIFVVGPFSSFLPWEEEAEKCFGSKIISARLVGTRRQSIYLQSFEYELFLCHYQTASNDFSEIIDLFNRHNFLMVIDESHNIKRFAGGVWANSLMRIAPYAKRRVILSGTPMPNGYIDLWSQLTFLWPSKQLLGERNAYKSRCDDENEHVNIKKAIRPFFYRVKKSDLKLPKPKIIKTYYPLNPIQAQIYHALSVRLISELNLQTDDRIKLKQWRKAKMVRLLQAASNPSLLRKYSQEFQIPPLSADGTNLITLIEKYANFEISKKFEVAVALIKRLLSEGKKVVLWTTFIHNIKMIEKILTGINYYSIHGAIPKDDNEDEEFNREKHIREFKSTKIASLLIANPAACAESISLHKICHDAIYLDRSFNCGQYIQSLDRIHRIGLEPDEIVNYHILIAKDTIDQTIDRRLDEKYATMIRVLEDDIPIGDLDIEGPELEKEDEEQADFNATINDVKKFIKAKKVEVK